MIVAPKGACGVLMSGSERIPSLPMLGVPDSTTYDADTGSPLYMLKSTARSPLEKSSWKEQAEPANKHCETSAVLAKIKREIQVRLSFNKAFIK